MRIAVKTVQYFVAILFIISGLIKANDPIGLSYKMQEFFELWTTGMAKGSFGSEALSFLHGVSLELSVFMITLEVLAGVALLLGWRKKAILWLLFLLIVFFTFLTGYAYLSGKFTNCGCFGDCLPITPLTSFIKDILLFILIVFLLVGQRYIQPSLSKKIRASILVVTLIVSMGLQWYVLNYLPIADCLPFKAGNHLPTQMQPPPGSVPDSFAIRFIYEKGGKEFEFAPENLPADFTTYTFVDRKQTLVRKGNADAAIKGFTLTNNNREEQTGNTIDHADSLMQAPQALLIFALQFEDTNWIFQSKTLLEIARQKEIPVAVVSPNFTEAQQAFRKAGISGVQFYNTDFTIVRTVARTNPTLLWLQSGRVQKKWSKNDFDKAAHWLTTVN